MDGLPVTIRLLDPPLHEFLPNSKELAVEIERFRIAEQVTSLDVIGEAAAERRHCSRPSSGWRSPTRCWVCAAAGSAW